MSEPIALAFEDREYTLPQPDALVSGMAGALGRRGVRAGERVALMLSNRPEFVIVLRAIWSLGAAAVLLSPAWKRAEVDHALALTNPAHAVGDHPVLAEVMPMLHLDEPITSGRRPVEAPDPWLRITDRSKEMIKVRGFQVAPAAIEAVLHGHPAVDDCAVIGVPDAAIGENVIAAVKTSGAVEADGLIELVADRLASYMRPTQVVFVPEIPRLPSGKVLRRVLKERVWTSV
jgi:acyl-CoA synthetase (AMP-forming)/AMP-acid ligase II